MVKKLNIPKVIGHRGAKEYAPENTLTSIYKAASIGTKWVEVDVKLTKDKQPIIFHDETVDRCTNGSGKISEITLEKIRKLDAGSWFDKKFTNEKIPTLKEVFDVVVKLGLGLNLEIKPCLGHDIETTQIALETLNLELPKNHPLLLSSFSVKSLKEIKRIAPHLPLGYLMNEQVKNWQEIAKEINASTICIGDEECMVSHINEYLSYGKPVIIYTVNNTERAVKLFEMGVSCVFSDAPDKITRRINNKNTFT